METYLDLARHGSTFRTELGINIQGGSSNEEDTWLSPKGKEDGTKLGAMLATLYMDDIVDDNLVIVSSPLTRCLQTAIRIDEAIGQIRATLRLEPKKLLLWKTYDDLKEINHGRYEGVNAKLRDELCTKWYAEREAEAKASGEILPPDWKWYDNPLNHDIIPAEAVPHPDSEEKAETINEVLIRAERVVKQLSEEHKGKRIIVVTSGVVMWALATMFEARKAQSEAANEIAQAEKKDLYPVYYGSGTPPTYPKTCSVSHYKYDEEGKLFYNGTQNLLELAAAKA